MTLLDVTSKPTRKAKIRKSHVVSYIRWSDASQSISESAQRQELQQFATKTGLTIVQEFVENVSGAAELRKRPALIAAMTAAKEHRCEGLLVLRIDRLCRNADMAGALSLHMTQHGMRVITADGASEDQSPFAVVMRSLQAGMAQIERSLIKSRTSAALQSLKAQGKKHTRIAPYGYSWDGGRQIVNEAEQAVIVQVKTLASEGKGATEVSRVLHKQGVVNRNGRPYSPVTMYQLMKRIGVL